MSAGAGAGAGGRSLLLTADDFTKAELDKLDSRDPEYIMDSFLSLMCVMVAGMAAGLTMGMLSVDELELEIFLNGGGARSVPSRALSCVAGCSYVEDRWAEDALSGQEMSLTSFVEYGSLLSCDRLAFAFIATSENLARRDFVSAGVEIVRTRSHIPPPAL